MVDRLYVKKVSDRISQLKEHARYGEISASLSSLGGIDGLQDRYLTLFEKIMKGHAPERLVMGHGDLCFSNILYDKRTGLLRFIDPKGALTPEEMYTDSLYDLAKLSHSIQGGYDFVNSGLFDFDFDPALRVRLKPFGFQPSWASEIFASFLERQNADPVMVRLCEASLFLSMLPLHADNLRKVLGFSIIAERIIDAIEKKKK